MIRVTKSSAKAKLSQYIDLAKNGETILITEHGVPVVKLESVACPFRRSLSSEEASRIERLTKAGVLRVPKRPMDLSWLYRPIPVPLPGGSILKALLDEREESR